MTLSRQRPDLAVWRRLVLALVALLAACSGDDATSPGETMFVTFDQRTVNLRRGDTLRVNASVVTLAGAPVDAEVRYSSSDTTIARVDAGGLVTARGVGTVEIVASVGGYLAHATVRVQPNVASIRLDSIPAGVLDSILAGLAYRVRAVALDSSGVPIADEPISFSSSDTMVARVDSTGVVSAVWEGDAVVTVATAQRTTSIPVRVRLVRIGTGTSWAQLDGGQDYACALTTAGEPHCFGEEFNARTGFATDVWQPTRIPGGNIFRAIYAGGTHSCGLDAADSTAWCWGPSRHGQLGNLDRFAPGSVDGDLRYVPYQEESRRRWSWLTVGGHGGNCGFSASDSLLYCWGHNDFAQLGFTRRYRPHAELPMIGTIDIYGPTLGWRGMKGRDASVDDRHGCMLTAAGEAYCSTMEDRGLSSYSWVGQAAADQDSVPWRVVGGHRFTAIATSWTSTCAIREDGRVLCWGYSNLGDLGTGERQGTVYTTPTPIASTLTFDRLRSTPFNYCARATTGEWWCWGRAVPGGGSTQAGLRATTLDLVSSKPWRVPGAWRTVEPSGQFICGLPATGDGIVCWGRGGWWEAGTPPSVESREQ
jgi:hypothetical protein